MKFFEPAAIRWLTLASAIMACQVSCPEAGATVVRFETSVGDIDVRLFNEATPNTVANFLTYATSGRYEETFIHRVPQSPAGGSSNFVVQGGGFKLNGSIFAASGIPTDAPIGDEPGITNIRGSLAMAKNSLGATSQWFFNIGDNSFLDAQDFTVFGRVLNDGMDVVDAINQLRTVNAAAAETPNTGEDFDEVPVRDFDQVISQNDITQNEAVMISAVETLTFPDGDYNFDGSIDAADYVVWRDSIGSTLQVEADGDGSGVVDAADYQLWRTNFGATSSAALTAGGSAAPEPASAGLALLAGLLGWSSRPRRA